MNLLSQDNAQVPESLWADVCAIDQETQTLRAEVERLTSQLATWQNPAPDMERFRAELAGLANNFKKIRADQQYKLLRSVIDFLQVDQDGDAWIFLLERAESWQRSMEEGAKRKRAHEKVRRPSRWLPKYGAEGTSPVFDRFLLPMKAKPPSQRAKKRRRAAENKARRAPAPPVVPETLKRVLHWQEEIDSGSHTLASIARRENLTRARVTQLMKLLELPDAIKDAMLKDPEGYRDWTIRDALRMVIDTAS